MVRRATLMRLCDRIRGYIALPGLLLLVVVSGFCTTGLAQSAEQAIDLESNAERAKSSFPSAAKPLLEFSEPKLEDRYRILIDELRCPKCQNQNLADSDAPIAKDLRRELHRLLEDGQDNRQILDFMTLRYGEFVRYRPSLTVYTVSLWLIPAVVLLAGVAVLFAKTRGHKRSLLQSQTGDEQTSHATISDRDAQDATQAEIERRVQRLLAQADDND